MMKNLFFFPSLLFITLVLTSGDKDDIVKINAKQVYYKGFKELQPLDSTTVNYLVTRFDVISGWDNVHYMWFLNTPDTVRKDLNLERTKYINEFISQTTFYSFPIKIKSTIIHCLLITRTDSVNFQYEQFLQIFQYEPGDSMVEPVLLLSFREFHDGLSRFSEYSDCTINSKFEIESKFVSCRESLDLRPLDDEPLVADTEIIKMKITKLSGIKILSKYNTYH